jgi:drug/metabolite transporter (DMT)-like permease
MAVAIIFATLSALSSACGAVLQRLAVADRTSQARSVWRTVTGLVRQPVWLLGALFLAGTFVFQALALYFGPLSVVQPVLVLELIFTLGLRAFLLHDDIASRTWSAAAMICLGLAAFLGVASPTEGNHVPNAAQWILAVCSRGLAVAVLLLLSRYGSPARRAALFGAATAVVWSMDAAFVKQTVDVLARAGLLGLLTHWPLYAMIGTGVLGTVLLQGAYAVGPLAASQATMLIVDPLASITLGVELFHEQLRTGPGYMSGIVASLTVLAAGVVMLSLWAPPVMTADELARLPGRAHSGEDEAPVIAGAGEASLDQAYLGKDP